MRPPLAAVVASLALLAACNANAERRAMDLERKLLAAVDEARRPGAGGVLDIGSLTDFPWDRLHVFAPYTPLARLESELGFPWPDAADTGIHERDDIALLVFVHAGQVVRHVEQPRGRGDFSRAGRPGGFAPAEARFEARTVDRGEPWLMLFPEAAPRP